jgi:hypothetical protein
MDATIRRWIVDVLQAHLELLAIPMRQRAKFEHWLKFELSAYAEQHGATQLEVEAPLANGFRSDVAFYWQAARYHIELKTPNTNYRMPGVENRTCPITKNVHEIIEDGKKLNDCEARGVVAFVLCPIPQGDNRWKEYMERISGELDIRLSEEANCSRVTIAVGNGHFCEAVVCCFACP